MRGYGDSDKPGALEDYKMAHLVNDVKEIIEALGKYTPVTTTSAVTLWPLVRKRTIPTDRPPVVDEI
jgi:pimeloyl-ACP methyl ester carboxylesterase